MNRQELQAIALLRIEEAQHLLSGKHYSGAYYLAGYAVECGLKACLAKSTREYDFPAKNWLTKVTLMTCQNYLD